MNGTYQRYVSFEAWNNEPVCHHLQVGCCTTIPHEGQTMAPGRGRGRRVQLQQLRSQGQPKKTSCLQSIDVGWNWEERVLNGKNKSAGSHSK